MKNLTALVSLFARAYHFEHSPAPVFRDSIAGRFLSETEKQQIAENMTAGIRFFCPDFSGKEPQALDWIVHHQLAPSVVGRSAFCEKMLEQAIHRGCTQYLMFASGYDTCAYRTRFPGLKIYELDQPDMIEDKKSRVRRAGLDPAAAEYLACDLTNPAWSDTLKNSSYDGRQPSFCSLLGISYYLSGEDFYRLLRCIHAQISAGSELVFDYQTAESSHVTDQNEQLARAAGEPMKGKYSYGELKTLLQDCGFMIEAHLDSQAMTVQYFAQNGDMTAPDGVAYVHAVKRNENRCRKDRTAGPTPPFRDKTVRSV